MANCSLPRLVGSGAAVLLVLLAIAAPSWALTDVEELMRFTYWTGCSPLRLLVVMESDDAVKMGLTEEAITTAVRSRLRAARLHTDTDDPETPILMMYVRVVNSKRITGGAFRIDAALHKFLYDPLTGLSSLARTNDIFGRHAKIGLHSEDAAFILSGIAQVMEGFLDEYLRFNEPACY